MDNTFDVPELHYLGWNGIFLTCKRIMGIPQMGGDSRSYVITSF